MALGGSTQVGATSNSRTAQPLFSPWVQLPEWLPPSLFWAVPDPLGRMPKNEEAALAGMA